MPLGNNRYHNLYQRGKPYPLQKRYEVIASYFSLQSISGAAKENMVSYNCGKKLIEGYLSNGTCDPKKQGGEHMRES